eukprot:Clim_evm11s153 gene=Clim_evmTU11s153
MDRRWGAPSWRTDISRFGGWIECQQTNPPVTERSGHSAVSNGHYLYIYGGYDNGVCYSDLWRLDLLYWEWERLETTGDLPGELTSHSAVLVENKMYLFGGSGHRFGLSNSSKLYVLDVDTLEWTLLSKGNGRVLPAPRYGQSLTFSLRRNSLYVYGGTSGHKFFDEVCKFDLDTREWTQLIVPWAPKGRYCHRVVHMKDKFIVVGGGRPDPYCDRSAFLDVYAFNYEAEEWSEWSCQADSVHGYPAPRRCHSVDIYGDKIFMFGGTDGKTTFQDLWRLNLDTMRWALCDSAGRHSPGPRNFHATVATVNGCLYVFGGCLDAGGRLRTNKTHRIYLDVPSLLSIAGRKVLSTEDYTEEELELTYQILYENFHA